MLIKRPPRPFPDLCTYDRQSNEIQIAMMHYLVTCVRSDSEVHVNAIAGAESYRFVKVTNVSFRHTSVDITIKKEAGNSIHLPIDLLVSIEPVGQA